MSSSLHSIEHEELMAYLDGELAADRATLVGAHLASCGECRAWVAESRDLSERLTAWQVEPAPPSLDGRVTATIREEEVKPQIAPEPLPAFSRRRLFGLPVWAWGTAGVACVSLLVAAIFVTSPRRTEQWAEQTPPTAGAPAVKEEPAPAVEPLAASSSFPASRSRREMMQNDSAVLQKEAMIANAGRPPAYGNPGTETSIPPVAGPMIVRTASLSLLTKDFSQTRAALEDLVRRHHGYSAQLTVGSEAGSAHRLSATFRLPADQLDAAMAEIKQLAHVEQESQGGEEVTEQYVDLTARLSNARRTEQTLLDVLEKRTGRLSDVLEVEQELARVREQIERMDAELKNLQNRVSYSTLQVELHEEYKAHLEMPPSIGGRLWNAMVDGYRTMADSLVASIMFIFSVGPFVFVWALLLFFPARYVWRRVRAAMEKG